jgi:hypothetical protein
MTELDMKNETETEREEFADELFDEALDTCGDRIEACCQISSR